MTLEDERKLKELDDECKRTERSNLHRFLRNVYGVLFVLIFVYLAGARDATGGQDDWAGTLLDTVTSLVLPVFLILFCWYMFVFYGWFLELLEWLGRRGRPKDPDWK